MITSLTGCSMIGSITGDYGRTYGEYVESLLDATMKGDYEKYIELTGADEESIRAVYDADMRTLTDTFIDSYGVKTDDKDIYNKMLDIVKQLCLKTQYAASEAIKSDGVYTVTVTVKPLDFVITAREQYNSFLTDWTNRYNTGELVDLSPEEYDIQYARELIDVLEDSLDKTLEQEAVVKGVVIQFSADTYYISDQDFMDIQTMLFAG